MNLLYETVDSRIDVEHNPRHREYRICTWRRNSKRQSSLSAAFRRDYCLSRTLYKGRYLTNLQDISGVLNVCW